MRTYFKLGLYSLFCGIIGAALVFAVLHLYNDHKNLHALVDMVVKSQQEKQQVKP